MGDLSGDKLSARVDTCAIVGPTGKGIVVVGPRMSFCRILGRWLVVLAVCSWLAGSLHAADKAQKPWRSTPDLSMGSQEVRLDGHCLRMSAAIINSSLAKLHKKRVASGTEFHRGRTVVDHFPDEVMVVVTVTDCLSPYGAAVSEEMLNTIRFAAAWRRGNEERPVGGIYVPHSRPRDAWSESNDTFRDYELSIESDGVPLSDHLVLTVSSSDGTKIARFVADL
jgi:hypothetical protein